MKLTIAESNKLLKLVVEKLREPQVQGHFNYHLWVGIGWEGKTDLSCGTSACAAGWATTVPEIRARGLVLVRGYGNSLGLADRKYADPDEALIKVFGLTMEEVNHLFYAGRGDTHDDALYVARKFEEFIQRREKGCCGVCGTDSRQSPCSAHQVHDDDGADEAEENEP